MLNLLHAWRWRHASWIRHEDPHGEAADSAAIQALVSALRSGSAPADDARHSAPGGGLAGTRIRRLFSGLARKPARDPFHMLEPTAEAINSLAADIRKVEAGNDQRELAHLRLLDALARALFARKWAQAFRSRPDQGRELVLSVHGSMQRLGLRPAPTLHGTLERMVEMAADSVRRAPGEPYVRDLQIRTLLDLGRYDEAAECLAAFKAEPTLDNSWHEELEALSADPVRRLPTGSLVEKLEAMRDPRWLEPARSRLPQALSRLRAEADPLRPPAAAWRLTLELPRDALDEAGMERLVGEKDADSTGTIVGLRRELERRFGVVLPTVDLIRTPRLVLREARATLDGLWSSSSTALAAQDDAADWGLAADAWPLHALLHVALRNLDRLPAAAQPSDAAAQAREVMLADRMPPDEALEQLVTATGDALLAVQAWRLSPARSTPLWGDSSAYRKRLLPEAVERQFSATEATLAVDEPTLRGLNLSIANAADRPTEGADAGKRLALVVRDSTLRPIVRALLRDNWPDLPVLALTELKDRDVSHLDMTTT